MAYCTTDWYVSNRVGIGTDNPGFRLVICDTNNPMVQLKNPNDTTFGVILEHTGLNSEYWNYENGYIRFGTANAERMRITNTGNIGIGTTSPTSLLTLAPPANGVCSTIEFNNGDNAVISSFYSQTFAVDNTNTQAGRSFVFAKGGKGYTNQVKNLMVIEADSGNVGIGCSLPRNKVEVIGSTSSPDLCTASCDLLKVAGSGNSALNVGSTVVSPYGMWMQVKHQNLDNLTYPLIFQPCGGNAGIGIMNPTYKLHVNGTFYAAGSSIKYKEGICNYDTDSCLFMCLKPVTYQYKDEFKHLGKELKSDIQIGLIAEDVADIMPELAVLVNEEDEKVVRNVDYEKLSIVLLAEVQKLRREVDTLKNN